MQFRVAGRDPYSGQLVEMTFDAIDAQAAFAYAQARGVVVDAINPVSHGLIPQPPLYHQAPRQYLSPSAAGKKNIRLWAVLLVLGAFITAVIEPTIGYLFAGLLILFMVLF